MGWRELGDFAEEGGAAVVGGAEAEEVVDALWVEGGGGVGEEVEEGAGFGGEGGSAV